jgi:hypothetical protein
MSLVSTIAVRRSTRDMLKELGRKGETYDELIVKLVSAERGKDKNGEKHHGV